MLSHSQLTDLSEARRREAQTLHDNTEFDGAVYLCGYAIELTLKFVILRDKLCGFPEDDKEFELYKSCKTHDLDRLLEIAEKVSLFNDKTFSVAWGFVKGWRSEFRYRPIGSATSIDSQQMIDATSDIMKLLCNR